MMKLIWSSVVALGVFALALPGQAQPRLPGAQTAQTPDVLPPSGEEPPATETTEPPKKSAPTAGYAYGDKASTRSVSRSRYRRSGPVVTMPGFEQTADGGSRLFVQLSQPVPVEERKAQGSITYVLKGASPRVWNNTNALVTVHFNTPVSRARLVPHGSDLHFIIDLRAAATPTWKMTEPEDKTATLAIEFPKGEYLQTGVTTPAENGSRPAAPAKAVRGKRGRSPAAPSPKQP